MNKFYETLNGRVELEEIRGHSRFSFSCTSHGHIYVSVHIIQQADGHDNEIYCFNSFDQTFLRDFSKALFADYGS